MVYAMKSAQIIRKNIKRYHATPLRGPVPPSTMYVYVQAHRSEIWNGLYALDVHREVHICVLLLSRIVTECNIK